MTKYHPLLARGRARLATPQLGKLAAVGFLSLAGLLVTACGDDDSAGEVAATHDDVVAILGAGPGGKGTCSISSCHGDSIASAGLDLASSADLTKLLVNVPSCEAPSMMLVAPGEPEKSWLYIKLTGAVMAKKELVADPAWGEPGKGCEEASGFGKRMPETGAELSADKVEQIRSWIAAGAPGR